MTTNDSSIQNRYIWKTSSVLGVLIALSGIVHGVFEILQGNKITETFIIQSIGAEHQRWLNGEEAFTLLHNFLITGIAAVSISCIIIYWSIKHLHKQSGPIIFLILYISLTLVGGGIAHILFFMPVYLYSRLIRKEISWRKAKQASNFQEKLARTWIYLLVITCLLFISALALSVFGIRGAENGTISAIIYSELLLALCFLFLSYFAAISRDIT